MNTTTATITKIPAKSNTDAAGEIESFVMENCRSMLLSSKNAAVSGVANADEYVGRMFECKTCGRKFPSFQALGGHRASHKKAKSPNSSEFSDESNVPAKSKIHACKICGAEFPIGQALGGHMRRHREELEGNKDNGGGGGGNDGEKMMLMMTSAVSSVTTEGSIGNSDANDNRGEKKRKIVDDDKEEDMLEIHPVAKKSSSGKKDCLGLDLDLSLWWKKEQLEEYNDAVEKEKNVDHLIKEGESEEFLKLDLSLPTYC